MSRLLIIAILISSITHSQKINKEKLEFYPDIRISIVTNHYFGENYLAKGHQALSIGAQLRSNWLHYNNFSLGIGVEKSTQKVTEYSIGGNIDKTNSNSFFGHITYKYTLNSKFSVSPEISYGDIELRQKSGNKFYGRQHGQRYGFGVNFDYKLKKHAALFSTIGYVVYDLNTRTTNEFQDYFNKAQAISLSLGFQF